MKKSLITRRAKLPIPIPRRSADSQLFPGNAVLDLFNDFRCDLLRTSFFIAWLLPGYCFTRGSTFFNHFALEFRKAQHDIKRQSGSVCGQLVDAFVFFWRDSIFFIKCSIETRIIIESIFFARSSDALTI